MFFLFDKLDNIPTFYNSSELDISENDPTLRLVKLCKELEISQSVISDIFHYKRGFSKDVIRKLANKFNVGEASFLKEYELFGKESNVA